MKRKKYKRKPFKPIDNEQFREIRLINRLTITDVARLLQVTYRTVANWESGNARIPYSAFKLLRFIANGELLPPPWKGWVIRGDTLISPVGRAFKQHELTYISHYFTMARYWQKDYERRSSANQAPKITPIRPILVTMINPDKSLLSPANAFLVLGYGERLSSPCRQRPDRPICRFSREINLHQPSLVISRPASGFKGLGFNGFVWSSGDLFQVDAFMVLKTCSVSTTASNSQKWENTDRLKFLCKPINSTYSRFLS